MSCTEKKRRWNTRAATHWQPHCKLTIRLLVDGPLPLPSRAGGCDGGAGGGEAHGGVRDGRGDRGGRLERLLLARSFPCKTSF